MSVSTTELEKIAKKLSPQEIDIFLAALRPSTQAYLKEKILNEAIDEESGKTIPCHLSVKNLRYHLSSLEEQNAKVYIYNDDRPDDKKLAIIDVAADDPNTVVLIAKQIY